MECFVLPAKARRLALIGFGSPESGTASIVITLSLQNAYIHLVCYKLALFFQIALFNSFRIPVFTGTSLPLRKQGRFGFPANGRRSALFFQINHKLTPDLLSLLPFYFYNSPFSILNSQF
jgi:hypothetical protein